MQIGRTWNEGEKRGEEGRINRMSEGSPVLIDDDDS